MKNTKYFNWRKYKQEQKLDKQIKIVIRMFVFAVMGTLAVVFALVACSPKKAQLAVQAPKMPRNGESGEIQAPGDKILTGKASYYEYCLDSGWCSTNRMLCAIRHDNDAGYPKDTKIKRYDYIKVTDLETGKWVVCQVTDYGPDPKVHPDRVVDLSPKAFKELKSLKTQQLF